uniref:Uncharacterized protein n=1 Tax=Solanum tuberosum TaxID=4113 RepID=M1D6U9_SOLTU
MTPSRPKPDARRNSASKSRCKLGNLAQLPCRTNTIASPMSNPHVSFSPLSRKHCISHPFHCCLEKERVDSKFKPILPPKSALSPLYK